MPVCTQSDGIGINSFHFAPAREIRSQFWHVLRAERESPTAIREEVFRHLELPPSRENYRALLSVIKRSQVFAHLFNQDSRSVPGITIESHSVDVLAQADRYGLPGAVGEWMEPRYFRLFLIFHDIGKSLPYDTARQSRWNTALLSFVAEIFQVPERERKIMERLLRADALGHIFSRLLRADDESTQQQLEPYRDKHGRVPREVAEKFDPRFRLFQKLESGTLTTEDIKTFMHGARIVTDRDGLHRKLFAEAAQILEEDVAVTGLTYEAMLAIRLAFYQADTSSYSVEGQNGRGKVVLEYIYELNPDFCYPGSETDLFVRKNGARSRLRFSAAGYELYSRLLEVVNRRAEPL